MASRRKSFADAMEGFSQSFLPIWSQLQYAQRWGDENRRRRRSDAMAEVDTALGRLDAKNAPQSAYDDLRDRMGSGEWADLIVPLGERITAAFPTLRERATAAGTDLGAGLRTAGGPQLTGALLNAGATPTYHDFSGPVQQDPEAQRRELEQMPEAIRGATGVSDAAMEEMLGQQDTYRRGLVEGEAQRRRDYLASGGTNHPQYHVEPITHGPHAGDTTCGNQYMYQVSARHRDTKNRYTWGSSTRDPLVLASVRVRCFPEGRRQPPLQDNLHKRNRGSWRKLVGC